MTITFIIIAITVLISLYAFKQPGVKAQYMMNPYVISTRNQYYRFITSGFIHNSWTHLLWNMISFFFFGTAIEQVFFALFGVLGNIYFIALYILGIVVSDVPSYFKHRTNPGYNALGASGGVAAVVFASILFRPLDYICLFIALCVPGFILGIIFLIYSYYQGRKSNDNINHDAHLYGALFGLLFCIVLYPPSVRIFIDQLMQWRIFD